MLSVVPCVRQLGTTDREPTVASLTPSAVPQSHASRARARHGAASLGGRGLAASLAAEPLCSSVLFGIACLSFCDLSEKALPMPLSCGVFPLFLSSNSMVSGCSLGAWIHVELIFSNGSGWRPCVLFLKADSQLSQEHC